MARKPTYRYEPRKTTVEDAISGALSLLREELGAEMREWHDKIPESLHSSDKSETINSTAETLEGLEDPDLDDLPEEVLKLECTYQESIKQKGKQKHPSRAARRDTGTSMLGAAADALRAWADEKESELEQAAAGGAVEQEEGEKQEDVIEQVRELADKLEEMRDEADGADFPGMFG